LVRVASKAQIDAAHTMMLTIKEAAAELRVSKQWLQYWLVEHPVDAAGVPFYVPMGNRKRFEPQDIDRIRSYMRDLEAARLGPSMKGKARLVGLMSQLGGGGYDELLKMREEEKRKKEAEKAKRQPQRRVRLPRVKPKG
jgi:DNA-binding transcriptional MerR regulator